MSERWFFSRVKKGWGGEGVEGEKRTAFVLDIVDTIIVRLYFTCVVHHVVVGNWVDVRFFSSKVSWELNSVHHQACNIDGGIIT